MEYLKIPKRKEDFKKLIRRLMNNERKVDYENLFSDKPLLKTLAIDRVLLMFRPQDRKRVYKIAHMHCRAGVPLDEILNS